MNQRSNVTIYFHNFFDGIATIYDAPTAVRVTDDHKVACAALQRHITPAYHLPSIKPVTPKDIAGKRTFSAVFPGSLMSIKCARCWSKYAHLSIEQGVSGASAGTQARRVDVCPSLHSGGNSGSATPSAPTAQNMFNALGTALEDQESI